MDDDTVYLKGVTVTSMEMMTDGRFTEEYLEYVRDRARKDKNFFRENFLCDPHADPDYVDPKHPGEHPSSDVRRKDKDD